jgi:hypothetical protein
LLPSQPSAEFLVVDFVSQPFRWQAMRSRGRYPKTVTLQKLQVRIHLTVMAMFLEITGGLNR